MNLHSILTALMMPWITQFPMPRNVRKKVQVNLCIHPKATKRQGMVVLEEDPSPELVLCLQVWKEAKSPGSKKGLEFIVQNRLSDSWTKVDAYEWYYHAQACFQSTGALSGIFWREWNKSFQEVVAAGQQENGIETGPPFSW